MLIYIPENEHGIRPNYYTQRGISTLLRAYRDEPLAIQFIADMLE
jgi:hypothetical protein